MTPQRTVIGHVAASFVVIAVIVIGGLVFADTWGHSEVLSFKVV